MLILSSAVLFGVVAASNGCRVRIFTQCDSHNLPGIGSMPLPTCDKSEFMYFDSDVPSGLPDQIAGWDVEGDNCNVRFFKGESYSGDDVQILPSWCLCPTSLFIQSFKLEETVPDDAFTVIFFSDVEENYRGHKYSHVNRVIDAMKDIGSKNNLYDAPFNYVRVKPELYIHGGDMSNYWSVDVINDLLKNRDGATNAWEQTWKDFYDAGIPMITVFGNHDWHEAESDMSSSDVEVNEDTIDFVEWAMEHAARVSSDLTYERFLPDHPVGQSYYKVMFKGVQIGMMGWEALKKSSDADGSGPYAETEQWNNFKASMQADRGTLLVSHVPIDLQDDEVQVENFVGRFEDAAPLPDHNGITYPMAAHLSGHTHKWDNKGYRGSSSNKVRDYTVTYPYDNYGNSGEKRGYYAILISPTKGVLQVKQFEFTTDCKKKGKKCAIVSCPYECCYDGGVSHKWSWSKFSYVCN